MHFLFINIYFDSIDIFFVKYSFYLEKIRKTITLIYRL
jgi:hypothetical protein